MAGNQEWDGRIEDLPAEILDHNFKDRHNCILKEVSKRLCSDTDGDWETLAEKLGLLDSLDQVMAEARVQSAIPAFLMLRRWASRSGSTAFVLLNALQEIQRTDVVCLLVQRLSDIDAMELSVRVENHCGAQRFLRVRTRKGATLHASVDNYLEHPPYWYDIIGPRCGISWTNQSGSLLGSQLTLKLRSEPCEQSFRQIYGYDPVRCKAPCVEPSDRPEPRCGMPIPASRRNPPPTSHVSQMVMNIPPVSPSVSVTFPVEPRAQSNPMQLSVRAEGPGIRLMNNLSSRHTSEVQVGGGGGGKSASPRCNTPPPPTPPRPAGHPPNIMSQNPQNPEDIVNAMQPMTLYRDDSQWFPHLSSGFEKCSLSTSMGNFRIKDSGDTFSKGNDFRSETNAKQVVDDNLRAGNLHETFVKRSAYSNLDSRSKITGDCVQKGERTIDRGKPSSHTCSLNPDYLLPSRLLSKRQQTATYNPGDQHERQGKHAAKLESGSVGAVEGEWDRVGCKESSSSSKSSVCASSILHEDYVPPEETNRISKQKQLYSVPQSVPLPCRRQHSVRGYVPHAFVENLRRSASSPILDQVEDQTQVSGAVDNVAEGAKYSKDDEVREGNPCRPDLHRANSDHPSADVKPKKPTRCQFSGPVFAGVTPNTRECERVFPELSSSVHTLLQDSGHPTSVPLTAWSSSPSSCNQSTTDQTGSGISTSLETSSDKTSSPKGHSRVFRMQRSQGGVRVLPPSLPQRTQISEQSSGSRSADSHSLVVQSKKPPAKPTHQTGQSSATKESPNEKDNDKEMNKARPQARQWSSFVRKPFLVKGWKPDVKQKTPSP